MRYTIVINEDNGRLAVFDTQKMQLCTEEMTTEDYFYFADSVNKQAKVVLEEEEKRRKSFL